MQPHRTRRAPSPLSQQPLVPHGPGASHQDPSSTISLQYDPRGGAVNESTIDDLSGLYYQQEPGLVREGHSRPPALQLQQSNHHPYQPPTHHPPRRQSPGQYPSRGHSPPRNPLPPRQGSSQHRSTQRYPSQQEPLKYDSTSQSTAHAPTAPARGSSLHPSQPPRQQSHTYVRGQEYAEDGTRPWHDYDASPHYSDEEGYGGNRMDLEKAFPGPRGFHTYGNGDGHAAYAYAGHRADGQPLINYVTNEWKQRPNRKGGYVHQHRYDDEDPDETWCEDCQDICRSRLCRRYVLLFVVLVTLLVYAWTNWLGLDLGEKARLKNSVRGALLKEKGYFGVHQQMVFPGTKQLTEINRVKVPGSGARQESQAVRSGERRLIVVGDIHGCIAELRTLLAKVTFNPENDHLVTTGDMVARGPESLQVVSLLMSHNASCVRGNHEDRVLLANRDLKAPSHRKAAAEGVTAEQPIKKGAQSDLELAGELDEDQLNYLSACPLVLDAGHVAGLGRLAITHAGLVPLLPLAEQDPFSVMNMRTIDLRSFVPSRYGPPPNPFDARGRPTGFRPDHKDENRDYSGKSYGVAWPALWDVAQGMLPAEERTLVLYGHDEMAGLTKGDWHYGLDGGCVGGGKLAALVISGDWRGVSDVKKQLFTVECKQYVGSTGDVPALGGS